MEKYTIVQVWKGHTVEVKKIWILKNKKTK